MVSIEPLAERFRSFAATSAQRSPLYGRLARAIADDHELVALLGAAPTEQRLPVLLFAAVHDLLLGGVGPELARFYPNLTDSPDLGDPFPAFRDVAMANTDQLTELIATRTTQTNEVGRCALFVVPLAMIGAEVGRLAMVDVGCSAGLNLLLARYAYDFDDHPTIGGPSTVHLRCATRGAPPLPDRLPTVAAAIGLDRTPIDVNDDLAIRWLEACVWPDQPDRFQRLVAAVALARSHGVDVRGGHAVDDLAAVVDAASLAGHPVVTTSWVLNYLSESARAGFVAELDRLAGHTDLSWIIAESPAETPGLPVPAAPGEDLTVLTLVRWRSGRRTVQRLATCHPHGYWLHWESGRSRANR